MDQFDKRNSNFFVVENVTLVEFSQTNKQSFEDVALAEFSCVALLLACQVIVIAGGSGLSPCLLYYTCCTVQRLSSLPEANQAT